LGDLDGVYSANPSMRKSKIEELADDRKIIFPTLLKPNYCTNSLQNQDWNKVEGEREPI
ncbi:hypothetical protein ABEB36_002937, partial [Hypothenemus hampei]